LTRTLEKIAERSTHLRLTIKRLIPIIPMIGWALAVYLIVANVYALPWHTMVAIAASAGVAIGFASQDILKNIFGGLMILLDRPFQVGDKIEIGNYYGEVVQIGLRSVRIVTPDDSLVSIPNGEVMNQSISNANAGESNAQVVAEFYLPPDIDLIQAKKIAYRAAAVSRYVYLNKPIAVIVNNEIHQGRSLLKMRLKAYVLDIRYEAAFASEMTEIVMQDFLRAGLFAAEQLSLVKSSASVSRHL
jgi:small-conductance mechanosensitive channel